MAYLETTFDHETEVGIVGEGRTLEEAFAAAARALFSVIVDLADVEPREDVPITCSATGPQLLFVHWIDALLAEAEARDMIFSRFSLRIVDGWHLTGRARGERFDLKRHRRGVEVKGLAELKLLRWRAGWRVRTLLGV